MGQSLLWRPPPQALPPAPPAIANKPGDKAPSSDATRVLLAATDLSGEASTASSWFRNEPLSAFSGKTAEQLARDGRTKDVLAYFSRWQPAPPADPPGQHCLVRGL